MESARRRERVKTPGGISYLALREHTPERVRRRPRLDMERVSLRPQWRVHLKQASQRPQTQGGGANRLHQATRTSRSLQNESIRICYSTRHHARCTVLHRTKHATSARSYTYYTSCTTNTKLEWHMAIGRAVLGQPQSTPEVLIEDGPLEDSASTPLLAGPCKTQTDFEDHEN